MALTIEYVKNICKIQQIDCCRYLVCGMNGFECAKTTSLKEAIDARMEYMNAKGDNCEGVQN